MKYLTALVLIGIAVFASGCATTPALVRPSSTEMPSFVQPHPLSAPKVALVLSGGGARGFAHIGVLRVLLREGLRPDLVVGSSAGAMVGAVYASGMPLADIEVIAASLSLSTLLDISPWQMLTQGLGLGLARGDPLEGLLRQSLPLPIQAFPVAFAAVATDVKTGETVVLNHGDAALAVRASSAVPGLYEPVNVSGRMLADGQIVSPLPVDAALRLGARRVVAVDVVYPPQQSSLTNPLAMVFQTVTIGTYRHMLIERSRADLVISPVIAATDSQLGLSDRVMLIAAGERAAEQALPALRALFEQPNSAQKTPL